jgi:hypothetical protein
MRIRDLPHALVAFTLALSLAATPSCSLLGPPNTFDPAGPRGLTGIVVQRTRAYVTADESLIGAEQTQRLLALTALVDLLNTSEPVSRAIFRTASEEPFAWHDAYVADNAELLPWQKDSDLLSTELLRERYWPAE